MPIYILNNYFIVTVSQIAVNQLIFVCVQEEERIKREHGESVNLIQQFSHSKGVSSQTSASTHKKGQLGKGSKQQNKTNKSHNAGGPKPDIKKPNTVGFARKKVIRRRIVIHIKLG